jgi:hypothetical protein
MGGGQSSDKGAAPFEQKKEGNSGAPVNSAPASPTTGGRRRTRRKRSMKRRHCSHRHKRSWRHKRGHKRR